MTEIGDAADDATVLQRSSRDHARVQQQLEVWLEGVLPAGAAPSITSLDGTSANGMSSETLLFDASWLESGTRRHERLVARLAPGPDDIPVFPRYDLGLQVDAIRLVDELTDVPVPHVWWYEADPTAIGSPFFVMGRVDGRVPPDVMPYNFGDSWLYDAPRDDQRRLQDATVDVIARIHAIDRPEERFSFLRGDSSGDTALRRRVGHTRDWYAFAAAAGDGFRSPLVERTLRWLDDHWPADDGETVACWGDSRIGNVIYDGVEPAAVLDWEMAALGPRELDVAWLVYAHRIFEDIAASMELGGMPHFLRADDVMTTYEARSGHACRRLDWFGTFAAVQYAIVFLRTGARAVHFGEMEMPASADDLILNREPLERMLAGTYWS
jgi:aminoglycoside phosphotransferase (APT) family kinase protein